MEPWGIAKPVPYDFTKAESDALLKIGEEIAKSIKPYVIPWQ
jgi:hypothetical protein